MTARPAIGRVHWALFALVITLFGAQSLNRPDSTRAAAAPAEISESRPGGFLTSDRCLACHKGVSTSDGMDVSIGYDWRASMLRCAESSSITLVRLRLSRQSAAVAICPWRM